MISSFTSVIHFCEVLFRVWRKLNQSETVQNTYDFCVDVKFVSIWLNSLLDRLFLYRWAIRMTYLFASMPKTSYQLLENWSNTVNTSRSKTISRLCRRILTPIAAMHSSFYWRCVRYVTFYIADWGILRNF